MQPHTTISKFVLPNAQSGLLPLIPSSSQQKPVEIRQLVTETIQIFNPDQLKVFNAVVQAGLPGASSIDLHLPEPELYTTQLLYFFNVPGGSGKRLLQKRFKIF